MNIITVIKMNDKINRKRAMRLCKLLVKHRKELKLEMENRKKYTPIGFVNLFEKE